MFAHLVLLLGLVYKPLTQLFWSQPKPPLMAHSAKGTGNIFMSKGLSNNDIFYDIVLKIGFSHL